MILRKQVVKEVAAGYLRSRQILLVDPSATLYLRSTWIKEAMGPQTEMVDEGGQCQMLENVHGFLFVPQSHCQGQDDFQRGVEFLSLSRDLSPNGITEFTIFSKRG